MLRCIIILLSLPLMAPAQSYTDSMLAWQRTYKDSLLHSTPTYQLFIPFLDHTSGHETFRDGRYIDFTTADIRNNTILIDFNKAYNTYAAYLHHYIYTTPYFPNILPMDIPAGEKIYGKNHGWKR